MFVRNFMTEDVVTIAPEVTLREALAVMESRPVRRLPVLKNGRLVGMITRSDILAVLGKPGGDDLTVEWAMARDPRTIPPDETLEHAALMMLNYKISGLPVVGDGKVVGIITESDIFRADQDARLREPGSARRHGVLERRRNPGAHPRAHRRSERAKSCDVS